MGKARLAVEQCELTQAPFEAAQQVVMRCRRHGLLLLVRCRMQAPKHVEGVVIQCVTRRLRAANSCPKPS